MGDDDLDDNPWGPSGVYGSNWESPWEKPLNGQTLQDATPLSGKTGQKLYLPEPFLVQQKSQTTCWAAAIVCWIGTTAVGLETPTEETVVKKYEAKGFVNADDGSLKFDKTIFGEVMSDVGMNAKRFALPEKHEGLDDAFLLDKLKMRDANRGAGYLLVVEAELETKFRHAYVVYAVDATLSTPWWWAMNPDGAQLLGCPIARSPGRWSATVDVGFKSEYWIAWQEK